jgi:hypothetical protein
VDAALRFVTDLLDPRTIDTARQAFGADVVYVAPTAVEVTGDSAIPQALAEVYADANGARADQAIVQTNRAFHTARI